MNRFIVAGIAVMLFIGGAAGLQQASSASHEEQSDEHSHIGDIRHVVVFKFKEDADPQQVQKVVDAFRALPEKIPQIKDFEWGTNNSPEGLNKGFTHVFLVTFEDEQARAEYLPHPAHKEFVQLLGPVIEDVFVVDYEASK